MAQNEAEFDQLIQSTFTDEERAALEAVEQSTSFGYATEPIVPGREELLKQFDGLLISLLNAETEARRREQKEIFLTTLEGSFTLQPGSEVMIDHVGSFVLEDNAGGRAWGVTGCEASMEGKFGGLSIGAWYDVPVEGQPEDVEQFLRPAGLLVVLKEAQLIYTEDSFTEQLPYVRVPLNHGAPELFRIIRPQA